MNIPQTSFARVVIVGGGFAGISLAKTLAEKEMQVVLLDKHNYHTFQPLLYQVATGGLEPDSIAYPIRKIIKNFSNFFFRLATVLEIDASTKQIHTDIGNLSYDYLVLATGSATNFFGNKTLEKNSLEMKTIVQSLNLRSLILENFEQALLTNDLTQRNALMNFVIVGAGPTGVELAGALAEIKKGILPTDYPDLDIRQMQIHLVQSGDRILNAMSQQASTKAEDFLEDLGVHIWKNTRVSSYDGKIATTNTTTQFLTETLIWAAGVKGNTIKGIDTADFLTKANRIKVDTYNRVLGQDAIFAIGDVASMQDPKQDINGHPMMAQPAIQQGKHLGKNLVRLLQDNKPMVPFCYKDKGAMATIGRNRAVVDLDSYKFQGVFAWFVWMFVHLFFLVGFRNRMIVFINWLYNYIRFDREARLIIRPYRKIKKQQN